MINPNRIEEGDKVRVYLLSTYHRDGIVLYTPSATGDCWHIQTDAGLLYIQTFEYMELIEKGKQP